MEHQELNSENKCLLSSFVRSCPLQSVESTTGKYIFLQYNRISYFAFCCTLPIKKSKLKEKIKYLLKVIQLTWKTFDHLVNKSSKVEFKLMNSRWISISFTTAEI